MTRKCSKWISADEAEVRAVSASWTRAILCEDMQNLILLYLRHKTHLLLLDHVNNWYLQSKVVSQLFWKFHFPPNPRTSIQTHCCYECILLFKGSRFCSKSCPLYASFKVMSQVSVLLFRAPSEVMFLIELIRFSSVLAEECVITPRRQNETLAVLSSAFTVEVKSGAATVGFLSVRDVGNSPSAACWHFSRIVQRTRQS